MSTALVLTTFFPPETEADRGGTHRRVGAVLRALQPRFERIDMLHIPAPGRLTDSAKQSAFWNQPVHTATLTRHEAPAIFFDDNIRGLIDLAWQHPWHRYVSNELIQQLQAQLDTRPDLIFAMCLEPMMLLRRCHTTAPILLDLDDIAHKMRRATLRQAAPSLRAALAWTKWPALLQEERKASRRATRTAVCSTLDAACLHRQRFPGTIVTIPNAIAMPAYPPGPGLNPTILYLGTMGYPPNAAAAERLVNRIWPLIQAAMPSARLILAGPGSDTLACRATSPPSVEFRGFVADLPRLYAETAIVCCPLTEGGGTRLKLIEAAGYARPIVSTAKGAEGLGFQHGREMLLAETDIELAQACVTLLTDPPLAARLAATARTAAIAAFDLDHVVANIGRLIDEIVPPMTLAR